MERKEGEWRWELTDTDKLRLALLNQTKVYLMEKLPFPDIVALFDVVDEMTNEANWAHRVAPIAPSGVAGEGRVLLWQDEVGELEVSWESNRGYSVVRTAFRERGGEAVWFESAKEAARHICCELCY